jgi:hypothetical protein
LGRRKRKVLKEFPRLSVDRVEAEFTASAKPLPSFEAKVRIEAAKHRSRPWTKEDRKRAGSKE